MNQVASGSGEFLFAVIGFIVLGLALAYGTMMWRKRRMARRPDTIGAQPGPAPKHLEGKDDRATVR